MSPDRLGQRNNTNVVRNGLFQINSSNDYSARLVSNVLSKTSLVIISLFPFDLSRFLSVRSITSSELEGVTYLPQTLFKICATELIIIVF
jgi:hypothetical protein